MDSMLLAQAIETAEKGVTLLERLAQGGALLITLAFLAIVGVALWWTMRRNQKLEARNAEIEREWREAVSKEHKDHKDEVAGLMREMLTHNKDVSEVTGASARAIEGFNEVIKDLVAQVDALKDTSRGVETQLAALKEAVRDAGRRG